MKPIEMGHPDVQDIAEPIDENHSMSHDEARVAWGIQGVPQGSLRKDGQQQKQTQVPFGN